MRRISGYQQRLAGWARGLPPLVVDAAIALACYLTLAISVVLEEQSAWLFVLAAGNALPLVWRRRYPFTVTLVTGVGTAWLSLADVFNDFLPAAQLVATYTFAALCPPLLRLLAVLGTVAGIAVSVLPREDAFVLGPTAIMFVVAYALGTGARARRDRIAMLEERARRLAEEQDAVAARERQRIAREMHDILAHSISLVAVQAEAGPVAVRSDPDKAEEVFDTISATAREALAQLRRALGVLRADGAAGKVIRAPQPGLDALSPLLAGVRRAGLAATLEEHGERRPVPADLATTAYRIVQESLTNTVKHAGASQTWVRLDWRDGELRLEVRDDGRGPDRNRQPGGGHGLIGMRERVAAAGGRLAYGAGPDGVGFQVTASLPVQ